MAGAILALATPQLDAMVASVCELVAMTPSEAAFEGIQSSARLFFERLVASDEHLDLICRKAPTGSAVIAGDVHCFEHNPSDEYLELFAAFAALHGNACTVICHGWPVLSPVSGRSHRMAEGGAESICAAGGLHA